MKMTQEELNERYEEILKDLGSVTKGELYINEEGDLVFDDGLSWGIVEDEDGFRIE